MSVLKQSSKLTVAALMVAVGISGPAKADSAVVDDLFEQLQDADPSDWARIEGQIYEEWSKSGSATIDLLVRRGGEAIEAGDFAAAIEHFTAAIDHDPIFAEAYNGRATAYYLMNQIGPSLDDIRETLVLNPRHFGAMSGFAVILEELDRPKEALEVYEQILDLVPAATNVQEAIERLKLDLEGQTL